MTQPQLTAITTITATLELVSGLRIGAGDSEMRIGGVDNTVIVTKTLGRVDEATRQACVAQLCRQLHQGG